MFEHIYSYAQWLNSIENVLFFLFMLALTLVSSGIALIMVVLLLVVPIFYVLKFLILTPFGWLILGFLVWMYGFENDPRPGYGVDASFIKMCARTKSCNNTLHARDKITDLQTEEVRPSKNITPVQE